MPQLFARQAESQPQLPAIAHSGGTWTYAELAGRCDQVASWLRDRGVRAGETVAVTGPRVPELIAAMLAIWEINAVLLPIDRALPGRRQRVMTDQARARWLVRADGPGLSVDRLNPADTGGPGRDMAATADGATAGAATADAAYVIFTSGTTGTPNAVLGSHRGLGHFLGWQRAAFEVGPGDRCAQLTGLSFDVVLRDIFLPLVAGATLCLPDGGQTPPPGDVCHWLERERVSVVHAVPTVAEAWLAPGRGPFTAPLRAVFFAGEPLTDALVESWREAWPATRHVINLYGPTETTLAACFHVVANPAEPGVQPLGRALPHIQALVVGEHGRLCEAGEPGEICIRSPFRSHGYLNNPSENARRFVPDPQGEASGDRLFRTGDLGCCRPDGVLEYRGRLDQQVKILGVRVQPEEVAAILTGHRGVTASRVVPDSDQRGNSILHGYYVPASGHRPAAPAELREYLADRLPSAMLPAALTPVAGFPVTLNGKLDRDALRPVAVVAAVPVARPQVAVDDPLLGKLADIWAEVLDIPLPAAEDDFFELGGHSLLAASMLSRVRAQFGAEVPLRTLLKAPTLGAVAAAVRQLSGPGGGRESPIPRLPRPAARQRGDES